MPRSSECAFVEGCSGSDPTSDSSPVDLTGPGETNARLKRSRVWLGNSRAVSNSQKKRQASQSPSSSPGTSTNTPTTTTGPATTTATQAATGDQANISPGTTTPTTTTAVKAETQATPDEVTTTVVHVTTRTVDPPKTSPSSTQGRSTTTLPATEVTSQNQSTGFASGLSTFASGTSTFHSTGTATSTQGISSGTTFSLSRPEITGICAAISVFLFTILTFAIWFHARLQKRKGKARRGTMKSTASKFSAFYNPWSSYTMPSKILEISNPNHDDEKISIGPTYY